MLARRSRTFQPTSHPPSRPRRVCRDVVVAGAVIAEGPALRWTLDLAPGGIVPP